MVNSQINESFIYLNYTILYYVVIEILLQKGGKMRREM